MVSHKQISCLQFVYVYVSVYVYVWVCVCDYANGGYLQVEFGTGLLHDLVACVRSQLRQ
jgi:hypothetical protein